MSVIIQWNHSFRKFSSQQAAFSFVEALDPGTGWTMREAKHTLPWFNEVITYGVA